MDADISNVNSITLADQSNISTADTIMDNDVKPHTDLVIESKTAEQLEQPGTLSNENTDNTKVNEITTTETVEIKDVQDNSQTGMEYVLLNEAHLASTETPKLNINELSETDQVTTDVQESVNYVDTQINPERILTEKSADEDIKQECLEKSNKTQNYISVLDSAQNSTSGLDAAIAKDTQIKSNQTESLEKPGDTDSDINLQDCLKEPMDNNSEVNMQEIIQINLQDTPAKPLHDESHTGDILQSSNIAEDNKFNLQDSRSDFHEESINEANVNIIENISVGDDEETFNHQKEVTQDNTTQDVIQENIKPEQSEQKQVELTDNSMPESLIEEKLTDVPNEIIVEPENVTDHNIIQEHVDENIKFEHLATSKISESIVAVESEIVTEHVADTDSIEQQMSNLVQEEEPVNMKNSRTLSIVEEISRDFDETDSEDVDRPDNVDEGKQLQIAQDDAMVEVSISDQLQHGGTVTVTDTAGQVYYVQSVEDLIVVENDEVDTPLDQPDTFELSVLSEVEQSAESTSNTSKAKEKSSIPSHILGRNIENPVIDTFRNGKIPPKPRLGVKIPYKNLTSQIVTKDEIAKEILERQKAKYKQTGQTTREMLFANKLTQRLAKKIAPTAGQPKAQQKPRKEAINNSDLLAILEGDSDEHETKKTQEAGSSKSNVIDASNNIKNVDTVARVDSQGPPLSKKTEREIALKQLQELPVSTGRRRRGGHLGMPYKSKEYRTEISGSKNQSVLEDKSSDTLPPTQDPQKKENEKFVQSNEKKDIISDAVQIELPQDTEEKKPTSSLAATEKKSTVEADINAINKLLVENKVESTKKDIPNIKEKLDDQASSVKIKTSEPVDKLKVNDTPLTQTKEAAKQAEEVSEPAKIKSNETKQIVSNTTPDVKKVDVTVNTTTTKTIASGKILNKADTSVTVGKEEFMERKTSNPPVKTYARKRKSTEDVTAISNVPDKKPAVQQKETNVPPNTYVTKSSRIIKRKVIWDPDEPSTARSLAGKSPKAEPLKEKIPKQIDITLKKPVAKPVQKIETIKSPVKSPDMSKVKKRLSEVDRLLMDEGAVNMLYAFKNDDVIKKKKTGVISLDKAQKELMNKTNELKKDLKTNSDKVSPKSLRKKDSPLVSPSKKVVPASVSRKKSKDSNRSSLHSPPASPSMLYMNHAEASRIIRRHSSSSFSSMDGDFDADRKAESNLDATPVDIEKTNKRRNTPSSGENNKSKRPKRNTEKENVAVVVEKGKTSEECSAKNISKLTQNEERKEIKYEKYKTFSVRELDHMVQIILLPSFNNEAYLTPEILNDLCNIMKELEKDSKCTVVVISSSASAFCHGINYKTLISDKEQSRKVFAKKLAVCVTNFLRVLATFPKILVAGVHGDTVGLGVTILPLFDMVIASDTATFSIPNARLGCAAEGGSLLSLPHLMHNVLVSELLYASRKLIAAEALRLGMVTRVLWPEKFQQELVAIVRNISNYSPQFMELTKKQLRQHMSKHIDATLSKEVDILIQHWTSSECQKNFVVYG